MAWFAAFPENQRRRLTRALMLARTSALTLLILGFVSALLNVRQPLSASFAISVAVMVNGAFEWRLARRFAAEDQQSLILMGWNQVALGGEILAYALWQALHLTDAQILSLLQRPFVRLFFDTLPPELRELVIVELPPKLRVLYGAVGVAGLIGCVAMAVYYRRQRATLRRAAGSP